MRKFYSLKRILKYHARYNMIFGKRSNGKTYAMLVHIITNYMKTGRQGVYLRRWDTDVRGLRAKKLVEHFTSADIKKMTNGQWNGIRYYNREYFLCNYNLEGKVEESDPTAFMFAMCLSTMEHDKGGGYKLVQIICFDEFLARPNALGGDGYAVDEFTFFMNTLSTLIRDKEDVQIFMLGNTISQYCPYFNEMGLSQHIFKQKPGTIDCYRYGQSDMTIAVEYVASDTGNSKVNELYFAFDNPKLNMITTGEWELNIYPHITGKIRPKDILMKFYVKFDIHVMQGNIVFRQDNKNEMPFVYFHKKTTDLLDRPKDIVFSMEPSPGQYRYIWLDKNVDRFTEKLSSLYDQRRFFYSDNSVGDIIENYITQAHHV